MKQMARLIARGKSGKETAGFVFLLAAVAALILAFDLSLPLGVAGGVPYVVLVLLGAWLPSWRGILVLAGVGTALTVVGYFFSPAGGILWVVLINRGLAIFAIWMTAMLLLERSREKEDERVRQSRRFVERIIPGKDRKFLWLTAPGMEIEEGEGEGEGLLPLSDITERKQLEGKLAEAQKIKALGELTEQLLSYTGKHPVFPQVVDVGVFVTHASDLLLPMLGETYEIEVVVADDLRPICVDRGQLDAALMNLAVNARNAMPKGGKITIEARNIHIDEAFAAARAYDVETGDYVMVAVSDAGAGMSQEVIEQAFDPFFTIKEVSQGTGLGLSMVYGFVRRQSDGHLEIESEEGRGTTVRLYFPVAEAGEEEA